MFSSSDLFNQEKNKNVLREYQIVDFPNKNKNFGSFKGTYPKQAAEKAFTFLSNIVGDEVKKDGNFIVFSIQQKSKNTNNNMNKELKFIGTVIKLENDVFNKEQNKMIKYKNILSKYNPDLDKIKAKNKKINYTKN
jgi:hypothetical protein